MRRKAFVRKAAVSLRRRRRIPAKNAERMARARARDFGAKAEWIRALQCATHPRGEGQAGPPSEPSHTRSRGAGGDRRSLIPQCSRCHAELHQVGRLAFESRRGLSLDELARRYDQDWTALADEARGRFRMVFVQLYPESAPYVEEYP